MTSLKTHLTLAAAIVMIAAAAPAYAGSCSSCSGAKITKYEKKQKTNDIVDVAAKAGSFNTLLAAAKAAGLVDALKGDGPLTVFAPTDAAFAKLPEGTVEALLQPENRHKLRNILLYHVVPGKVMAADVVKLDAAKTVFGQSVSINADDKGVHIDGARVVKTDIGADNGVIHVIDSVILPKNIAEVAEAAGQFKTLLAAVEAAGLTETISSAELTVFAPTDKAFAKLPEGTVKTLLKKENLDKLRAILTYHVAPGTVKAADVVKQSEIATANGQHLSVEVKTKKMKNGKKKTIVMIDNAKVVMTDIPALNGVIHVIDAVVLPSDEPKSAEAHGHDGTDQG